MESVTSDKGKRIHFLIVEDDEDVRDIICLLLGSHYSGEFIDATNGKEAVEILRNKGPFDIVISDFNMPEGNGQFVFDFLKEYLPEIPFLLMTSDSPETHPEIKAAFRSGFMQKPFLEEQLFSEVDRLLSSAQIMPIKDHDYVPISIQTLAKIRELRHPLFIKMGDSKYIKILHENTLFDSEAEKRMQTKGLKALYVEKKVLPDFISRFKTQAMSELIFNSSTESTSSEMIKFSHSAQELVAGAIKSFGWSKDVQQLAEQNIKVASALIKNSPDLKSIFAITKMEEHDYSISHSILICYATAAVLKGVEVTFPHAGKILAMASFFHDISLDEHQVKNEDRFIKSLSLNSATSRDDKEMVKAHPLKSAEMLKSWPHCPEDVLAVIREHHEKPDGSGFPNGLSEEQMHKLTPCFIVAHDVVDSYLQHKNVRDVCKDLESKRELYKTPLFQKYFNYFYQSLCAK